MNVSNMGPMMTRAVLVVVAAVLTSSPPPPVELIAIDGEGAGYWTRWRGPSGQGHVTGTNYVEEWSSSQNLKWRTAVPGIGHSSPIVWKDHIFLTTARNDGARMSMLAFRRSTGEKLWETDVPTRGVEHKYPKNSHASATATTDGERVYASFGTHGLAAFDFTGKLVWQAKIGDLSNYHGSAGSPVLYKDRLFIYQDHDGTASTGSFVAAFDKVTGKTLWKTPRMESVGWGTPIVIRAETRDEIIVSSQRRVAAYDPQTGKELWTVRGMTFEVIPTPVVGHGFVFCSSGRAGPTFAIRPGGTGDVTTTHVAWSAARGSPFVPSGLVHGDLLYLINDMQSVLTAYEAKTGAVVYQSRLGEPTREGFSSSPVAIGDKLFFTNDQGQTFVVSAGREFKLLRTNTLPGSVLASPALVDGVWYWRTDSELIAIGK
jgi:outer membrane protein assembly factor BamB